MNNTYYTYQVVIDFENHFFIFKKNAYHHLHKMELGFELKVI
jgi:hypothetical protein